MDFTKKMFDNRHQIKIMPETIHKKRKAEILRSSSNAAFIYSDLISQTRSSYADVCKDVFIANSEGLWVTDRRVRTRFSIEAVASSENEKQSGRFSPGGSVGFELFSSTITLYFFVLRLL